MPEHYKMTSPNRKIEVNMLRVGMYVSQLDRPWIETPFLFQGFYIRTEHEIEELQRYCESVEIDIEQSDPAARGALLRTVTDADEEKSSPRHGISFWRRLLAWFGGKRIEAPEQRVPGEFYKDTASTADELIVARTVHSGSLEKLMNVLATIRQGEAIAMPDLVVVSESMVDSVLRNSTAMALLAHIQAKDEYMGNHSLASSIWALVFGRHLGLDRESLSAVGLGGLLLDVGKTKLPEQLLQKEGKLTEVEWAHVQGHVEFGLEIIREASGIDSRVVDMVATHHERFDGTGYPKGWKANQIPVFGRIGGIVDSYSAMTSDKPYAKAISPYDAMREFKALSDKHFQAEMVEQFIQAVGIFPVGTLVELNTGEVGVVLKEHEATRLQPDVALILDPDKQRLQEINVVALRGQKGESPDVWIERGIKPGAYDIDASEYFL